MKKAIALALILLLGIAALAGCGGKAEEPEGGQGNAPADAPEPAQAEEPEAMPGETPDAAEPEEAGGDRVAFQNMSLSLVDGWYIDEETELRLYLRQETDAFDTPAVDMGLSGGESPKWEIEEYYPSKYEGIQRADDVTVNGIEYLMAEDKGNQMFWLYAMPGALDEDNEDEYMKIAFSWIDLAGAKPLMETFEINW